MRSQIFRIALAVLFLSLGAEPSASASEWDKCNRNVPDLTSCTRLIESKRSSGKSLANLHYNRSVAYFNKCQYDRSIADSNKAIALDRKFAQAYYIRGVSKLSKGKTNDAILDFKRASRLGMDFRQMKSDLHKSTGIRVASGSKFTEDLEVVISLGALKPKGRC